MDNTYGVGVKFKGLAEITSQELLERTQQIEDLSKACGRNSVVRCFDKRLADVFYYFLDRNNALNFYARADNVPSVAHCVWDNQPLFEQP
jgi:hypothetical protein